MFTSHSAHLLVCSLFSALVAGCFAEAESVAESSSSQGTSEGGSSSSGVVVPPGATDESSSSGFQDASSTVGGSVSSSGGDGSSGTSGGPLDADGDGVAADLDCDDTDPTSFPGATEVCDLKDNDCDGTVDWARSVPTHFATIAEALHDAPAQAYVCVGPGTYAETLALPANVTLDSAAGPEMTVLSPPGDARVVSIFDGDGAALRGFTLTDGLARQGAGILVHNSIGVVLEDLWIVGNHAIEAGVSCEGVGLMVRNGSSVIGRRLRINDNDAACRFSTGVVRTTQVSTLVLENSTIVGNVMDASESVRSPITSSDGTLQLRNVIIAGNVATAAINIYGGAVYLQGVGNYAFENVTIADNVAVSEAYGRPGAVLFNGNAQTLQASLTNVTVTGNELVAPSSPITSGGIGFEGSNVELVLDHSNLWGNVPGDYPSGWESPIGVDGNVSVEPGFVDVTSADPGKWDLRLAEGSPLRDAGTPYIDDPDRSVSDIGAYGGPGAAAWAPERSR